jgi:hypothetical protein
VTAGSRPRLRSSWRSSPRSAGYLHFGPPKTRAGYRRVGLPRVVVEALPSSWPAWIRRRPRVRWSPGGTLRLAGFRHRICGRQPGRPGWMGCGPMACGIRRWHCGLRWLQSQGGRRPGRHTSLSFTLDRYGHRHPDAGQALRDRLDALHDFSQGRQSAGLDGPETDQEGSSRPDGASQSRSHRLRPAGSGGGRDRARTCDLVVVSDTRYHCATRP